MATYDGSYGGIMECNDWPNSFWHHGASPTMMIFLILNFPPTSTLAFSPYIFPTYDRPLMSAAWNHFPHLQQLTSRELAAREYYDYE